MPRKQARGRAPSLDVADADDDEISEGEDEDGSDDKDSGDLMQMLAMLNDIKNKKATKMSSTHLQQKKTRVKEARKETKKVRSQGDAFINQSLEVSRALSHNRIEPDDEEFKVLFLQRRTAENDVLKDCDDFLKGLSTARVKNVQEASDTVVAYDGRRSHARRQLKRKAKQDFELQVEQAQIAADARELIKGYKRLIMQPRNGQ